MDILIKGGRVICAKNSIDVVMDIYVRDGVIEPFIKSQVLPKQVIDASGCWVVPGLIDMHVHFRDPGAPHKETIETGAKAAAAGGFTAVCCMPNTSPVIDCKEVVDYIKSKEVPINVLPVGCISKGLNGMDLSAIYEMKQAGICAISDDGKTVENPRLMLDALIEAAKHNLPVFSHCEDLRLVGDGQINEGNRAIELNLEAIPPEAEEVIVARDIILAKKARAKLHICHISTAGAVALVREAKRNGQDVTAEVCPHHFTLTSDEIPGLDANYKMSPALRNQEDKEAILEALKDGTIDVIATDHAPHAEHEKNCLFNDAPNGIMGLETAVPIAITELVNKGVLTPSQLISKFTSNPASILNLDSGCLSIGKKADITIIDPNAKYVIDRHSFVSKSRNTPFHGKEVFGRVLYTICGGNVVYSSKRSIDFVPH